MTHRARHRQGGVLQTPATDDKAGSAGYQGVSAAVIDTFCSVQPSRLDVRRQEVSERRSVSGLSARRLTASPLVAALAQAVLDQQAKRARLVAAAVHMVVGVGDRPAADEVKGTATATRRTGTGRHFAVIEGGRRAEDRP
jgi:hypothetical protein